MSGIFRRDVGPASVLFGLLALLCTLPAAPVRAGGAGPNVGDPCNPPGQLACGDPIIVPNGNVFETVTDFTTDGQNPLAVTRYYNSSIGISGGSFGAWSWTYDRKLIFFSATETDADRPDGKEIAFSPDGSGGWKGLSDLDLRLTKSGSIWTLTDWQDNVETYKADGSLASIEARNGYTQTLLYNANKQLTSVTDSFGRTLKISYGAHGRISSITAPDGLVLTYSYDTLLARPKLVKVGYSTSPPSSQT